MNTIDKLKMFCGKGGYYGRDYIRNPFNVGAYVVATNGHVVAWVASDEKFENEVPENVTKRIAEWIVEHKPQSEFLEFDYNALHGFEESTFITCDKCDGEGEAECFECGHESVCHECDGEGKIERAAPFRAVKITDKNGLQEKYIKLIIDVGGKIGKEEARSDVFSFEANEINGQLIACRV